MVQHPAPHLLAFFVESTQMPPSASTTSALVMTIV